MKITERALRKIILEEIEETLSEINKYHDSKGRWSSKKNAKTVSLSNKAKKYLKNKSDAPIRGTVTSSGAISTKYGANTGRPAKQCGKITFPAGTPKSPTRSCKDYPERYKANESESHPRFHEVNHGVSDGIAFLLAELDQMDLIQEQGFDPACKDAVKRWLQQVRLANLNIKSAADGKAPQLESDSNTGSDTPRPKSHYRGSAISPVTRTSADAKSAKRKRKWFKSVGYEVPKGGFSREEKQLLNPENLSE